MTVYVDVLILLNFYIDYLIIRLSIYILKLKVKPYRVILASFFASLTSLAIFLPESIITQLVIKFVTAFIIALILNGRTKIIKISLSLLLMAFVFNGVFEVLSNTIFKSNIASVNGCVYLDISLTVFGLSSLVIYIALKLVSRLFLFKSESEFKVKIIIDGNEMIFNGMSDSGNRLKDYLTGKPIIVCPDNKILSSAKTLRLLPFNTIDSEGMIRIIKPNVIELIYSDGTKIYPDALVGIAGKNTDVAVVNPCVLI